MTPTKRSSSGSADSSATDGRSPYVPEFKTDADRTKFRESLLSDLADHVKATNETQNERPAAPEQ